MEQGWVYVLVNSSIPGMAKVGRTTRASHLRLAELSSATGVATPFVLAFEQAFQDCARAERDIHVILERRGLRVASNREFFRGSPGDIVRVIVDYAGQSEVPSGVAVDPSGMDRLAEADRLMSSGKAGAEHVNDAIEACRFAVKAGVLQAHERLARLYKQLEGRGAARRAMQQLREGARHGNYYCYSEMAALFAAERQTSNFHKAWDMFFTCRARFWRDDVETASAGPGTPNARYVQACRRYIAGCLAFGCQPGHVAAMRQEATTILAQQLADLERLDGAPDARRKLVHVMRWTYLNLATTPKATEPQSNDLGLTQLGEIFDHYAAA